MKYSSEKKKSQSFRIGKKFTHSTFRYKSQEKANSISSQSSQFSKEYVSMASMFKIKPNKQKSALSKIFNNTMLDSQGSFFRNQFSIEQPFHEKSKSMKLDFVAIVNKNPKNTYTIDIKNYCKKQSFKQNKMKFLKIRQVGSYSSFNDQEDEINPAKTIKSISKNKKEQVTIKAGLAKEKQNLLNHISIILNVYSQLNKTKINMKQLQLTVKTYILEKNQGKIYTSEEIFENQMKPLFKQMIAYERVIVVGLIDLIYHQKLGHLSTQCRILLMHILSTYSHIITLVSTSKTNFNFSVQRLSKQLQQKIKQEAIIDQRSFTETNNFISVRILNLFRYSSQLTEQISIILHKASKITINRTFYNLLTQFAIHLNIGSLAKLQNNFLKTFATCPSPFIPQPRAQDKKYTLVVDLDETLIHADFNHGKCVVKYRPNSQKFIAQISIYFQIIIFTSSVSSYAKEILKNFKNISHALFREHTMKTKSDAIKDLSRIGRPLQSTLIIDNLFENFQLQPENGIHIKSWYGQAEDRCLFTLQQYLLKMIQNNPKDLREQLKANPLKF